MRTLQVMCAALGILPALLSEAPCAAQRGRSDGKGTMTMAQQKEPSHEPLSISGALSRIRQPRNVVVRNSAAWQKLWKEHAPGAEAPEVDFGRHDVVAIFAGQRPTGGYAVRIDSTHIHEKTATVDATVLKPAPGTIVPQMVTYPFAMRAVAKLPARVVFHIREAVRQ